MVTAQPKQKRVRRVELTQHQVKVLLRTLENISVIDAQQEDAKHLQAVHSTLTQHLEKANA